MNTAREIGDNWIAVWVGCGILVLAAVQYLVGGVRINNSFGQTWFTRKKDPNAFWFWLGVYIVTGLIVVAIGLYGLLTSPH